ncbi:MAG: zinc ribbon domain-containing protein [Acidobacteria bacterium]|nr:MAG: zinc ribbon domain-containing protein [Acidobacteriota bacterium]
MKKIELDIPNSRQNRRACPKCGLEQDGANTECIRCGVIFEKYRAIPGRSRGDASPSAGPEGRFFSRENIKNLLFHVNREEGRAYLYSKGVLLLILFFWGFRFILAPIESNVTGNSFLHLINLPFHEAGHVVFRPFGRLITSMGGSLGQLLVPLICCLVLLIKTRDPFGGAVTFWWFGENFLDLAPYINDARSLALPLIGGNTGRTAPYGFHDWQFILTETGLLNYDHVLARGAWLVGTLVMLCAVFWGAFLLVRQFRSVKQLPD